MSENDGSYKFDNIKAGDYTIRATMVEYEPAYSAPFAFSGANIRSPGLNYPSCPTT
jgi:hypothetical protein